MDLPPWLNISAWTAWEIHRKELRKKLTPSAIKLQWRLLEKYSKEDQLMVIENSIRNSWTGLFDLKVKQDNKPRPIKASYHDMWVKPDWMK